MIPASETTFAERGIDNDENPGVLKIKLSANISGVDGAEKLIVNIKLPLAAIRAVSGAILQFGVLIIFALTSKGLL
jgi:hypothetical protein